jgi:hypothetical protein
MRRLSHSLRDALPMSAVKSSLVAQSLQRYLDVPGRLEGRRKDSVTGFVSRRWKTLLAADGGPLLSAVCLHKHCISACPIKSGIVGWKSPFRSVTVPHAFLKQIIEDHPYCKEPRTRNLYISEDRARRATCLGWIWANDDVCTISVTLLSSLRGYECVDNFFFTSSHPSAISSSTQQFVFFWEQTSLPNLLALGSLLRSRR